MKNVFFLAVLLAAVLLPVKPAEPKTPAPAVLQENERILIILDLSQSMKKRMGTLTRLDAARLAFKEVFESIPEETELGLRLLGHRGSRDLACEESELAVPFGTGNRKEILRIIDASKAVGRKTPLHFSLERALEDFAGRSGKNKIILLSDGEETCRMDPLELTGRFIDLGIPIFSIGIGSDMTFSQLGGLSLETGGKFLLGSNLDSLKKALSGSFDLPEGGGTAAPGQTDFSSLVRVLPLPSFETELDRMVRNARQEHEQAPGKKEGATLIKTMDVSSQPKMYLEIIFDASGSMAQKMEGRTKLDLAKKALQDTLKELDSDRIHISFRAFGFDPSIPQQDNRSCLNTELLVGFEPDNTDRIVSEAAKISAHGNTPIARSLELAGEDLKPYKDESPHILLLSDGNETCGGDPVEVIRALRAEGFDVNVYVIGFDLEAEHTRQLKEIAAAGSGTYYDARSFKALAESFKKFSGEMDRKITESRIPKQVSGGMSIDRAEVIKGGFYALKGPIPKGENRYFRIDSKKGQRTLIENFGASSTAGSRISITLLDRGGKRVTGGRANHMGETGRDSIAQFMDMSGGGFAITLGDSLREIPAGTLFEVFIQDAGDIYQGLEADAVSSSETIPLLEGENLHAHLGLEDRADTFRIGTIAGGSTLTVELTEKDFRFQVDILNSSGQKIERSGRFIGEARVKIPGPGEFYIRFVDRNPVSSRMFSSYSIQIDNNRQENKP